MDRARFFLPFALLLGAQTAAAKPASKAAAKAAPKVEKPKHTSVLIETSMGNITAELFDDKAPKTVANFLEYADAKHYDGTIFHRVIGNFMVQGGGFDEQMNEKPTRAPVENEASNGLKNEVGTLAMARTPIPDSATSQFFINVQNNAQLDFKDPSPEGIGYCVFGKVTGGMDVVDAIKKMKTTHRNGMANVPETPVVVKHISRKK
jgi:cyclophilin family peptidyl-prolyl cis-trans isomerase